MNAGFNLKEVLEISDDQPKQNAFYFIKNYPNIPVILPSEWENDEYLNNLKNENIDLMCCNCPCSSLSSINRHASVDGKNNIHFYRLFNIFEKVQPKTFVVENAPTLIKLGKPILNDMINRLSHLYRFTIIHDKAGNHNVAMNRLRTMIVGWRKDYYKSHPLINPCIQKQLTVSELFADIINETTNDIISKNYNSINHLYKFCEPGYCLMTSLAMHYLKMFKNDTDEISNYIKEELSKTKLKKIFFNIASKISSSKRWWDKSLFRPKLDGAAPSFSSVQEYMHPIQNRGFNLLELKRLMNYPDTYDFSDPNNECKIPVSQALAQGVPANFGKWIAEQVHKALDGKLDSIDLDDSVIYQDHIKQKYTIKSIDEFLNSDIEITANSKKLYGEIK
jgi:site-specific DNA-cytosine methylase